MKKIYITFLFLFIIISSIFYFINKYKTKSDINPNDLFKVNEKINTIENINISTDEYGLKTVNIENINDFYFALGVLHANDRLWQIDYQRRRAEGRLSEVLGEDFVQNDKMIRCFNIKHLAIEQYNSLSPNSKKIIDDYSNGINYFIENQNNNLSIEFNYLGYKPEKWTGYDCISILLLHSLEQSENIPLELKKHKLSLYNLVNSSISNNNIKKIQQFEKTLSYLNITSDINQDFSWEINSNNNVDSLNKKIKVLNYLSFIKNDNLSAINNYYPIKVLNLKNVNFHFTVPGVALSNFSINNHNQNLKIFNFNENIKKIFSFNSNLQLITNENQSFMIDSNTKINYEVDTLNIKNKSKIQFYKRYISSNNEINSNNKIYIISDYLLDYKNGKIKTIDYSNENNGFNFYFNYNIQNANNSIERLFNDFHQSFQNSNLVIKSNFPNAQNSLNADLSTQDSKVFTDLFNQRELLNEEINYSKVLLINSQISDIMLQQNLIENELDKKLLNLIKQVYYNNFNDLSIDEKDLIHQLIINNSLKFTLFKKFELSKISKIKPTAKIIQSLLIDNLINNILYNFYNYNQGNNSKFIKNEIIENNLTKNNYINFVFKYLDSGNINTNFNIIDFSNANRKIVSAVKKSIYDLDNENYTDKLIISHPISNENLLKYNSSITTYKFGDINSLKFAQNNNIYDKSYSYGQSYKFIIDYKNSTLYYVLCGGVSGIMNNIHYKDQMILWEKGGYCKVNLIK